MKRLERTISPIVFLALLVEGTVLATPSTTYWTTATSDVQPFNVWHIGVDNYFRLYQTQQDIEKGQGAALPTDVGLTVGVLPFEKLNMEVGIDYLGPATFAHPTLRSMGSSVLFNAKLGTPEGAFLGSWFPAFNVGIFNVGTKSQVTSMNIVDFLVGKTLGAFGRIHGGGYHGSAGSGLMRENGCKPYAPAGSPFLCAAGQSGKSQNSGGMVGYDYGFWKVKDKEGNEYNKWVLAADYASGKNYIGGGGLWVLSSITLVTTLLTGAGWVLEPLPQRPLNGDVHVGSLLLE